MWPDEADAPDAPCIMDLLQVWAGGWAGGDRGLARGAETRSLATKLS